MRLPKAKDALDFALHAVASVVPAGAEIMVFGANDEGIRSAASHLEVVAEDVATVDRAPPLPRAGGTAACGD